MLKHGVVVTEPLPIWKEIPHLHAGDERQPCERCRLLSHAPLHAINPAHLEQLLEVWEQEAN